MIYFGQVAAGVVIGCMAGWVLGYIHRGLIETGCAYGRLFADISRAVRTGRWT